MKQKCDDFILLHSDNDPYVPIEEPQHHQVDFDKSILKGCVKAVDEILENPENYDGEYSFINKENHLESYKLKNIEGFIGKYAYNI